MSCKNVNKFKITGLFDFVKENATGRNNTELMKLVNEKFGTRFTKEDMKHYKGNRKISSGLKNQITATTRPKNPIKKGERIGIATEFKKGSKPQNTRPVGTEVLRADGLIWVKVNDNPGPHNVAKRWIPRSKVVWEKANGPLPNDLMILHLDGDSTNDELSNLKAIPKRVLLLLVNNKLIHPEKEITLTGVNIALVLDEINKKKKKKKE